VENSPALEQIAREVSRDDQACDSSLRQGLAKQATSYSATFSSEGPLRESRLVFGGLEGIEGPRIFLSHDRRVNVSTTDRFLPIARSSRSALISSRLSVCEHFKIAAISQSDIG